MSIKRLWRRFSLPRTGKSVYRRSVQTTCVGAKQKRVLEKVVGNISKLLYLCKATIS